MRSQHAFFMDGMKAQQTRLRIYISNKLRPTSFPKRTFGSENELIAQCWAAEAKTITFTNGTTNTELDCGEDREVFTLQLLLFNLFFFASKKKV